MVARRVDKQDKRPARRPAATSKGREDQIVSLAMDLAEKQLVEGTASAQVISHYLKLGSTREQLEQQRLMNENMLLNARVEALQSQKRIEELYEAALNAMRTYAGQDPEEVYYDED